MSKSKLYEKNLGEPFPVSRTKIDFFLECPHCFYIDQKLGVKRPGGPSFTLNSAVDALLKKEFDIHRAKNQAHPLMKAYKIDAVPLAHELIDEWRNNFKGIRFLHEPTNLQIFGAIDDVWQLKDGTLAIVDYKATSTLKEVTLEDEWKEGYKRQMEVYQWLFRKNGFTVSNTGYFVYCNGLKDKVAFDAKLEFDLTILPYTGSDAWVEPTILEIKKTLESDIIPEHSPDCEWCQYLEKSQL